jgi:sensor histidine kinase YesM
MESGIAMLGNLGQYLRAALPRLREAQTSLGQEVDLVSAYFGILGIRMGSRLHYAIDVPDDLAGLPFPPMMLLTLAENAIKHGLGPAPQGGSVTIRARAVDGVLEISVADSGVGFAAAPTSGSGIGLANTRARLSALYGEAGFLALAPNVPSGVVATIRMPLAAAGGAE